MGSVNSEDIACEIDPFEVKNTDVPFSLNMDKLTRHRAHQLIQSPTVLEEVWIHQLALR